MKGNDTLTQPKTVNDNTTGGIKPILTSSNPNGGDLKATVGTVFNENNPLQNNESTSTPRPKSPKDVLGNEPKAEDVNANVKPKAEQLQDKMQGKDLIKTIDKTPTNDKPKVETRIQNLPVGETKVKDEKLKKN